MTLFRLSVLSHSSTSAAAPGVAPLAKDRLPGLGFGPELIPTANCRGRPRGSACSPAPASAKKEEESFALSLLIYIYIIYIYTHTDTHRTTFDLRHPAPLPVCLKLLANPNCWGGGGGIAPPSPSSLAELPKSWTPATAPGEWGHPHGQGPGPLHLLGDGWGRRAPQAQLCGPQYTPCSCLPSSCMPPVQVSTNRHHCAEGASSHGAAGHGTSCPSSGLQQEHEFYLLTWVKCK